ncbi:DEAD/DEAH box helicase family protein [Coralliovum pocilloporae]|uniref:DEAD/DEAH box helicase family protein n=1 Tax=Coralliovum pocilloporae TaxID=3066369 RepID=UPI003306D1CF
MSTSNFSFLTGRWGFLAEDAGQVEKYAQGDPRAACIYARRALELALKWLYDNDTSLDRPFQDNLAAMIHERSFSSMLGRGLFTDIKSIHKLGNIAAHGDQRISSAEGVKIARALHSFLGWLVRVYTKGGPVPPAFNPSLLPKSQEETNARIFALVKERMAEADAAKEKLSKTEEELERIRAELAALQQVKDTNRKAIPDGDYSEAETRDLIIDVMLREAGWDPKAENVEEFPVTGMPTTSGSRDGKGFVDYVLWGDNGKPLALVEAKRTRVDPRNGKQQAALYADCLEARYGQRPVIYYSNGYETWLWDDCLYPPRQVEGFATRDELAWKINQREGRKDLSLLSSKLEIAGRHYQMEAASRVMQTFGKDLKRKSLIVMATGTGKTRLAISIVDMLMRGGWVRKVLFLADRVSLVTQAKRNFNALLPHVSVASLLEKTEEDARILFSTYPTMLNLIDGSKKDQQERFSASHFDLIIVDEAHRSVYQKYGAIFDYFDSLVLGLTATPRGEVDRNTYKLFELDDHQPTFSYELEQAVEDGFLVPPRAISVPLKFQREGIKYDELSPEEQEEYELRDEFYDEETGELIEAIEANAINKWLFNIDTVNKVLAHLMENGITVEGGDKIGKTIIFAKNSKHADFIVEQFNKNYPALGAKFCEKIDHSVKYAQSLIDDFSINGKEPQIAVSVDMLDTGIDIPEVVNLVFFKIVRSKTKFWQMIGRGTRLCPDLFLAGEDKREFVVFDYCQNLEFFDANPEGYEIRIQESVKQKTFKRRLDLVVLLDDRGEEPDLSTSLKDQMHAFVTVMELENFIVRRQRRDVEFFRDRSNWNALKPEHVVVLSDKISGLPSHDEDDEFARRFDLLIANLQLAVLKRSRAQEKAIKNVRKLASGLEEKAAIPSVNDQLELILALQTDEWWQDVTLPLLEDVRIRLRELIKFIDNEPGYTNVFTNFEDELGESSEEHQLVKTDANMADYRRRVQRFISDNKDHLTIRRLRNNEPISRRDVEALEDILFAEEGPLSREEYEILFGDRPLGVLIRSTVGLTRKAAKEALAEFFSKTSLLPDQMTFLDQVVDYLVRNGTMEPKVLFETPFTHVNHEGLSGIFDDEESDRVIRLIRRLNRNADAVEVEIARNA